MSEINTMLSENEPPSNDSKKSESFYEKQEELHASTLNSFSIGTAELRMGEIKEMNTNVTHPEHYTFGDIECIDAIEASMSQEEFKGFLKGNAMKYLWRYPHKGRVTDIEKAAWYLEKLSSLLKSENNDDED